VKIQKWCTTPFSPSGVKTFILTCWVMFSGISSFGQQLPDVDSMYKAAKNIGFRGVYDTARMEMDTVLLYAPNYLDARTFIARTLSWENHYEKSRAQLKLVLDKDPNNYEALDALVDAFRWPNEIDTALAICEKGMSLFPSDTMFRYKKHEVIRQQRNIKLSYNQIMSDSFYMKGRALAFKGKYQEGRVWLDSSIKRDPLFFDAYILKARTFSWQKKYDEGRPVLNYVLLNDTLPSRRKDAYSALADLEMYASKNKTSGKVCDTALIQFKKAVEFHKKKSVTLANEDYYKEAIPELQLYLDSVKTDTPAVKMMEDFKFKKLRNYVGAGWVHQMYNPKTTFAPWDFGNLEYGHRFRKVQSIGRINYAKRFGRQALQFEVDNYIKIFRGTTLFTNIGISNKNILYPRFRLGAEVYQNVHSKFDVSLGYHMLFYQPDSVSETFHMIVGSIGYYYKKWWFSYRPVAVLEPYGKGSTTLSNTVQARWYYKSDYDYVTFMLAYANGAIGLNNPTAVILGEKNFVKLQTIRAGIDFQRRLNTTVFGGLGTWCDYDEYSANKYRYRFTLTLNLKKVF